MEQTTLFNEQSNPLLTIQDVASALSVSDASVRNWIKTGYLDAPNGRLITQASFEKFRDEVVGSEKLNKRANKSRFDEHDHNALSTRILTELDTNKSQHLGETVALKYENSLSNSYRNKEGIYYTPLEIADQFFGFLPKHRAPLTFCDPCCGSGNFIVSAIKAGVSPENIFGFDIDLTAVEIAKRRVFENTGYETENIICADFFDYSIENLNDGLKFDVIFTNPPWGKKIPKETKLTYAAHFGAGSSVDTCSLFFFAAKHFLEASGYIGLLLPEAFFTVATFYNARCELLKNKVSAFFDFGKPFKGLLTKAKAFVAQVGDPCLDRNVLCQGSSYSHTRLQSSFFQNPSAILNFTCPPDEAAVLSRMFELPHTTLTENAKWGLGIVTGNNKRFCLDKPREGYIPVHKGAEVHKDRLDGPSAFIPEDFSLYQQVAPKELYCAKEKLIYRFISSNLVFFHDRSQTFFLNSANMVVLNEDFPIKTESLGRLLNTRIMNWAFQRMFETHKVLRSDIEKLPIYADFISDNPDFKEEDLLKYLGIEGDKNGTFRIKD